MKRFAIILVICLILPWLVACSGSSSSFESEKALIDHLEGFWRIRDIDEDSYLLIENGEIRFFSEQTFTSALNTYITDTIKNKGHSLLSTMSAADIVATLETMDIADTPYSSVTFDAKKGKAIIDKGEGFTTQIVVQGSQVTIQDSSRSSFPMEKVSDTLTLSSDRFLTLCNNYISETSFSANDFMFSPAKLLEFVKTKFPEANNWPLTSDSDGSRIYTSNGKLSGYTGAYILDSESVFFTYNRWGKSSPEFMLWYDMNADCQFILSDDFFRDYNSALEYVSCVMRSFPGSISPTQLWDLFSSKHNVSYEGTRYFDQTHNNIGYYINQNTTGAVTFRITFPESIELSSIINSATPPATQTTPTTTDPTQPESTDPKPTEPTPTEPTPTEPTQKECSHSYTEPTCTAPATCKLCGKTNGYPIDHNFVPTTCTNPYACSFCGEVLQLSKTEHQWKKATCTQPQTCSACGEIQGEALGHFMGLTKCSGCDYTDYSTITKTYPTVTAYDSRSGDALVVTDVSVNNSGILSFTFNGTSYSIQLVERVYDSMTYFDCYQNGNILPSAECRIGDDSYYNMLHFEWDGVEGHRLYFHTPKNS